MQSLTIKQIESLLAELRGGKLEARAYMSRYLTTRRKPNGQIEVTILLYSEARDQTRFEQRELPLRD